MSSRGEPPDDEYPFAAVGRHLREERERRGLSGIELDRATGVDQSQISKYEKGRNFPSARAQVLLETFFGWPAGQLLRWAGRVAEPQSLGEFLAARPGLSAADVDVLVRLIEHLEGRAVLNDS